MMRSAYAVMHFHCDGPCHRNGTMITDTKNTEIALFEVLTPDVVIEKLNEQYPGWTFTEGSAHCPQHSV